MAIKFRSLQLLYFQTVIDLKYYQDNMHLGYYRKKDRNNVTISIWSLSSNRGKYKFSNHNAQHDPHLDQSSFQRKLYHQSRITTRLKLCPTFKNLRHHSPCFESQQIKLVLHHHKPFHRQRLPQYQTNRTENAKQNVYIQFHVNISCELFYFSEILGLVRQFLIRLQHSKQLIHCTPCPEKGATLLLPLTLPNASKFSQFFHRQT